MNNLAQDQLTHQDNNTRRTTGTSTGGKKGPQSEERERERDRERERKRETTRCPPLSPIHTNRFKLIGTVCWSVGHHGPIAACGDERVPLHDEWN
jgi:hypothetical protein